jgi:NADH-quinone oxidoreductase subunit J
MISLGSYIPALAFLAEAAGDAVKTGASEMNFGAGDFFFYLFAVIAVFSAFMVVTAESPISSALFMVVTFFATAALYALLSAHFLAVIQVLVYAGAIMVLFLFVIMLLDLRKEELIEKRHWLLGAVGFVFGIALIVLMVASFRLSQNVEVVVKSETDQKVLNAAKFPVIRESAEKINGSRIEAARFGTTRRISKHLFREYLFPFEVASLLLLVGIIGVVVISRRRRKRRPPGEVIDEEDAS